MPTLEVAMPKTNMLPKTKGPQMNDRDFVNDILAFEKYLMSNYSVALHEMQNPGLTQVVKQSFDTVLANQQKCFEAMFQHGWYKMKAADAQEIAQTHQQFTNYQTQIPQFS